MSDVRVRLGIALAAGLLLASAPVQAAFLIVEVKTSYDPHVDFVGVQTTLTRADDPAFRRWQHQLIPSADVHGFMTPVEGGVAIRVAEFFDLPAADYRTEVKLIDAAGTVIVSRGTIGYVDTNTVWTTLIADTRVAPNGTAEKTARLLNDNDGDGRISPGDVLRYTVALDGRGATEFRDAPACGGRLVAGSVTTTHGTIASGNGDGDTAVRVTGLALTGEEAATVTFDVEVVPTVQNQGRLRFPGGDLLTDDPSTPAAADATVTPVACSFVTCAGDPDGDGVGASLDLCPDTPAGAAVDDRGCSAAQFCGRIAVDTAAGQRMCRQADWRGDEPTGMPRDCRPAAAACAAE